jgi:hypothetical protein
MLRCVEFVEQVTEMEEGASRPLARLWFQLHRLACRYCRRYLRQMRAVREVMQAPASPE